MATLTELLDQRDQLLSEDSGSGSFLTLTGTIDRAKEIEAINEQINQLISPTPTVTDPSPDTGDAIPSTEGEITDVVTSNLTTPTLPPGTEQTFTSLVPGEDEFVTGDGTTIDSVGRVDTNTLESTSAVVPDGIQTSTVTPATIDEAAQAQAAQGEVSEEGQITDVPQAQLSEGAIVDFEREELDKRATIQGQLSMLFDGVAPGEIPIWAKPAVDLVDAQLSARGVSRSTIARDSLYNAVIGTALNIAGHDAQAYQQAWLVNMDTKNKVAMFNAANIANMDMKNADFLMQAQIHNAQAFLQMDFQNMENEQRTNEINMQAQQQVLLSNQSAVNAASQFNASSENQIKQFMTQLAATIQLDNASRADAMLQFNEANSVDSQKFLANLSFQRDQFNAQMSQVIEQSNVDWRRNINQINTAGINAVNQANATNLFNLSNQSLTFLWQEARDNAYWAWMSSENDEERSTKLAMAAMTNEAAKDKVSADTWASLGAFAVELIT